MTLMLAGGRGQGPGDIATCGFVAAAERQAPTGVDVAEGKAVAACVEVGTIGTELVEVTVSGGNGVNVGVTVTVRTVGTALAEEICCGDDKVGTGIGIVGGTIATVDVGKTDFNVGAILESANKGCEQAGR